MTIDHVRATGAFLLATFLYQIVTYVRGHRHLRGIRPKEWPARLFLLETGVLYGSWCVAGILLLMRRTSIFHDTGIVFGQAGGPRGMGLLLFLAANGLLFWTRRTLGANLQLAGVPPRDEHQLVTHGPYRIVRHPLYLASVLMGPGLALIVGSWLFLAPTAAILLTLPALIALEEGRLTAAYGDAYRAFARRTRRLVPFVWSALIAAGALAATAASAS